jgi:hypothetical protein
MTSAGSISPLSPERLPATMQVVSHLMEQDAGATLAKKVRNFQRNQGIRNSRA